MKIRVFVCPGTDYASIHQCMLTAKLRRTAFLQEIKEGNKKRHSNG